MRPIRAVLVDIDDTLVDTRGAFRAALRQVLGRWLPELTGERLDEAIDRFVTDPGGHFAAFTRGEVTFAEQRRARAVDLHAVFDGPPLDDVAYQSWVTQYEAGFRDSWRVLPDAQEFVSWLGRTGFPYGVLTNMAAAYQRDKLRAVGLPVTSVLVTPEDLGRGKPDPAVFRLACERLGFPVDQVAYLGDELDVDARGARDAGLLGIWVDRHGTGQIPGDVPVVRLLTEVPALLGLPDAEPERPHR